MSKILQPSQQFNLQQTIARKSITEFRPKIQKALQGDFNKAAELVKEMGVFQLANYNKTFFNQDKISDILRTLYEGTGGYTAMRYQKIFDKYKKAEDFDLDPLNIMDEWLAFMLSYWVSISGPKMYGIQNTTDNEIARILNNAIAYGRANNLSTNETNAMAIQMLREGKINNARSLLIARTESHQALSTGAIGADNLFIELMIAHHEGGIHMAEYAMSNADNDEVVKMATGTVAAQQSEIIDLEKQRK